MTMGPLDREIAVSMAVLVPDVANFDPLLIDAHAALLREWALSSGRDVSTHTSPTLSMAIVYPGEWSLVTEEEYPDRVTRDRAAFLRALLDSLSYLPESEVVPGSAPSRSRGCTCPDPDTRPYDAAPGRLELALDCPLHKPKT